MNETQQIPADTRQRNQRRQRFREHFMRCPLGMVDLDRLAEDTKIPWRTIIAYLRELHREGLVQHKSSDYCKHGLPFNVAVWSRIK